MRRRRLKAQITIMAALVFGLIATLMSVLMESIVHTGIKTKTNIAVNLGVQSVFSQYSKPLLDRYEVFGGVVSEPKEVLALLYGYVKDNCVNEDGILFGKIFDPYSVKLQDLVIEEEKYLTDDKGTPFYDEITNYMMYGQFDDEVYKMLPELLNTSHEKAINTVDKQLKAREKEASQIDAKILRLVMYVEGIQTTSAGFKHSFGHLCSASSFVKKICVNGTAFGQTGLDHGEIYSVVSGEYLDLMEELDGLKSDLDLIIATYNSPLMKGLFIDIGYRNHASQLAFAVDDSLTKVVQALNLIGQIEDDTNKFMQHLSTSRNVLNAQKGKMDANSFKGFTQEFNELLMYGDGTANSLCNIQDIKSKLEICQGQLTTMKDSLVALAWIPMDINTIGNVYGEIDSCKALCSSFIGSEIRFNYENISLGKGSSLAVIEKVQEVFAEGLFKYVLGDKEVSSKNINFNNLSSQVKYVKDDQWTVSIDPEIMYKDYLYNKYVSMKFSSFINPSSNGLLEYEMEYILGDSMSDQTNLQSTITQLINFRFAMNFSHMLCNPDKKSKCKATAITLLGFTGVHGVIKLGQYLLMSAWTYAEAVNDVKILVAGGKVPLKKTAASWKTNLEDIMEGRLASDSDANPSGFKYEDYIQLLLFLENKNRKIFRTMDMMEINMIQSGYEHSRMYKYLYSIKGNAVFSYWHGTMDYQQDFAYQY